MPKEATKLRYDNTGHDNAYMEQIRESRRSGHADPYGVPKAKEQKVVTVSAVRAEFKRDENGDFVLDDEGNAIPTGKHVIEKIRVYEDQAESYAAVLAEHKENSK